MGKRQCLTRHHLKAPDRRSWTRNSMYRQRHSTRPHWSCTSLPRRTTTSNADSRISLVNIKLDNIEENIKKQTTQELEAEADSYIQKGNEAQHSGNYDEAAEYFATAKEIYAQTGNVSQAMNAGSKQEGAQYGPDQQQALQSVLDGMSYMACGDYESAIDELGNARDAYNNLGDTSSATAVGNTITSLQQLQKALYSEDNAVPDPVDVTN